jgi:hypothetical protein
MDTSKTSLAWILSQGSKRIYHSLDADLDECEDFGNNRQFIQFDHAYSAWLELDEWLLSEAQFFSLVHTLEAKSDLDASIELLKAFYYRQALASLRSFLEDVLLPFYFFFIRDDYKDWKAGTLRVPSVRGKDGIISLLRKKGIQNPLNLDRFDRIYETLNHSVHGHSETMIHSGLEDGEWRGLSYNKQKCMEWLEIATEAINTGIEITRELETLWMLEIKSSPPFCSCCHSEDYWKTVERGFGGVFYRFECTACGSLWYQSS